MIKLLLSKHDNADSVKTDSKELENLYLLYASKVQNIGALHN